MIGKVDSSWIQGFVSIVVGGGFLGGIYALLKLRPEAGQITVTSAQGALIVQTGVIDNLNEDNKDLRERIDRQDEVIAAAEQAIKMMQGELEKAARTQALVEDLRRQVERLSAENKALQEERSEQRATIAAQNTEIAALRAQIETLTTELHQSGGGTG